MALQLQWIDTTTQTIRGAPLKPGRLTIGSRRDNSVVIELPKVSRRHAELQVENDDTIVVTDLNSKNGVYVNGVQQHCGLVRPGDALHLGPVEIRVIATDKGGQPLGIVLSAPSHSTSVGGRQSISTSVAGDLDSGDPSMRVVVEVVRLLAGGGVGRLETALLAAMRSVGGVGAAIFRRFPATTVTAYAGDVDWLEQPFVSRLDVLCSLQTSEVIEIGGQRVVVVAPVGGEGEQWMGVVGPTSRLVPAKQSLGIVAAMIGVFRSDELEPKSARRRGLRLPNGYVRGEGRAMRELYSLLHEVAPTDIPLLITGETGVGKEWIAGIAHQNSTRARGPFVPINCATLNPAQAEAELFGIEERAASGVAGRIGAFRCAHGGTLFLDEVAEMDPSLQAMLLRALESGEVRPVGARRPVHVDARVVAATNRDSSPTAGMRRDLYHRLAGIAMRIPPLRERRDEIKWFFQRFLEEGCDALRKRVVGVRPEAVAHIHAHEWPGNVRQLRNVALELVARCPTGEAIDLPLVHTVLRGEPGGIGCDQYSERPQTLRDGVAELKRQMVESALRRARGNKAAAARELGISRQALGQLLKRIGDQPS